MPLTYRLKLSESDIDEKNNRGNVHVCDRKCIIFVLEIRDTRAKRDDVFNV